MTTSNTLKLITVFGAAGAAALTPAVLGASVPTAYVGVAGVLVGVAYGLLHYLEQKEDGLTQQTLLQAIEQIISDQIPLIIPAVAALVQKNAATAVVTGGAPNTAVVITAPAEPATP